MSWSEFAAYLGLTAIVVAPLAFLAWAWWRR